MELTADNSMKLTEDILRNLKDKTISIENLDDRCFLFCELIIDDDECYEHSVFDVDNVLKLLNENICSFQEVVDRIKNIKDEYNSSCLSCLCRLLENKKLLEELIENKKLTKDDLEYLLIRIDEWNELYKLRGNTSLLMYIVDNGQFKELVDKFKSMRDTADASYLWRLLENKKFSKGLFEESIEIKKLTQDDLRHLLNRIDEYIELAHLCNNTSLIKYILSEFILDENDVDKFTRLLENDEECKEYNIHTIFELIEYYNKKNEELLKLTKLSRVVYNFDRNQCLELIEILKNNKVAQNTLNQIIDNNIEDQYDFATLRNLLTKDDKKQKIKMNF